MLGDTIWAVATPQGAAARGAIRVSGPGAFVAAARVCASEVPRHRAAIDVQVRVLGREVAALCLAMPGPRSYTGEDVVELHLPGAPLLLEEVGAALDVRRAMPGEFTRRAFESGRISLDQAEAVLDLIHAADVEDARKAAVALRGGLRDAVAAVRARIDDARAWIEAGLDFTEGETGEVERGAWTPLLAEAEERLAQLAGELPRARPGGDVLLLGAANAGKSSLCNALAGRDAVIVSGTAGTTRDVVAVELRPGLRLLDAPGDVDRASGWDRRAVEHRDAVAGGAAAAVLVVDPTAPRAAVPDARGLRVLAVVLTRGDVLAAPALPAGVPAGVPVFVVGNPTGAGIGALRGFLERTVGAGPDARGARVADAFAAARAALRRAAGTEGGAEIAAFELAEALAALDSVDGSSTPDDVLDRIFARFCLGK